MGADQAVRDNPVAASGDAASGGDVAQRVAFAAVAIPLGLAVVWYGGLPLAAVVALVAGLGTRELFDLSARSGVHPARAIGLFTAAAVPVLVYLALTSEPLAAGLAAAWPYALAVWLIALLTWALAARAPEQRPLAAVAVTLFAVAYTSVLPSFLLVMRHGRHPERSWAGAALVFFPLIVTWICDTAAMFGGRAIGGPKLAPRVSPGKTRSGALFGVAGGVLVAPVFWGLVFPLLGVTASLPALLLIAGVLAVVGQVGDLGESLLKREAGVKDSSHLIPGHGGVLDRFDSLYFVIPSAALLYRALGVA